SAALPRFGLFLSTAAMHGVSHRMYPLSRDNTRFGCSARRGSAARDTSCCLVERRPSRTRGQGESGPRGGSAAGEVRRALLGERGHALLGVLAREQVAEALDLGAEVTLVLALECQIERGLSGGECDRAAGGERAGGLSDL